VEDEEGEGGSRVWIAEKKSRNGACEVSQVFLGDGDLAAF